MRKILTIMIIMIFLSVLIPSPSVEASYRISLTGAVDFVGKPWVAENYTGYVIVGLGDESQGYLDINIAIDGDIASWVVWNGSSSFRLYPSEQKIVRFSIVFPASAPDSYDGQFTAIGIAPAESVTGGAVAPGNVAASIGATINIPARVYFQDYMADGNGANSIVYNGRLTDFIGNVSYNLSQGGSWIETLVVNISSVSNNESVQAPVSWDYSPRLGIIYNVVFTLLEDDGTLIDMKTAQFRLQTPADIESIGHRPSVVYADYNATIVAKVHEAQNGQTFCTAHFTVDGGSEQTGQMTYDSGADEYLYIIYNTTYTEGSYVEYWVSSYNDASGNVYTDTSEHNSFRVYSSTTPDLVIDGGSISISPLDPRVRPMNETNITNIFINVRNIGRGDAANIAVRIYNRDVPIWNGTIPSIAGDGNSDVLHYVWLPLEGTYVLRFVVDPDNEILESNENNNYHTLDEITIYPAPPEIEDTEDQVESSLPFIIIPIIILAVIFLLLFFLRKGKKINVIILKSKPFRADNDGNPRWIYNCGYGDDQRMGNTSPTTVKATKGDIIQVEAEGISERADGRIIWQNAKVVKLQPKMEKPDPEDKIRKLAKAKKEKK